MSDPVSSGSGNTGPALKSTRSLLLKWVLRLLVLMGIVWWAWEHWFSVPIISTDNAYSTAEVAAITPLVGGPVLAVHVLETGVVQQGDLIAEIDPSELEIAVRQAEAGLAMAERETAQLFAHTRVLEADVAATRAKLSQADADQANARAGLDKAERDYERRQRLYDNAAIGEEELNNAETALQQAQANLKLAEANRRVIDAAVVTARSSLESHNQLIEGLSPKTHPAVLAAQSLVDQARLNLQRTQLFAPFGGIVTQLNVEIGQLVEAGQRLMYLVPAEGIYVEANFKENQLAQVALGQRVEVVADLYGDQVIYQGRVSGIAGGTGAAFAAIPEQNATGNWIKVIRRLPVRIELDPKQVEAHPLRIGLSMQATVYIDEAASE